MEQLKNINKLINNNSNLEVEIKLGKYINTQFTADVNEVIFVNLLKSFNNKIINKRSISCYNGHNRVELFLNNKNEIILVEELNKERIINIDLHKDNMRISLSKETLIFKESNNLEIDKFLNSHSFNMKCFRYKDRQSIEHINKLWRFDFTKIYDVDKPNTINEFIKKINNNLNYRLEVEIEYIGDYTDDLYECIKEIKDEIKSILNIQINILEIIQSKLENPEFNDIINLNPNQWNSKQLMTSVQNLNSHTLNNIINSDINYSISEKVDGERCLLYICNNDVFRIDKSLNLNFVSNIKNNSENNKQNLLNKLYLFDVEFLYPQTYLIFDCIIFDNKDISSKSLDKRITYIEKLNNDKKFQSLFLKLLIKVRAKKHNFSNKTNFFDICKKAYLNSKYKYPIDGLIFTPIQEQYRTNIYKWKPPEEQSVDFFIIITHRNRLNKTQLELILDLYVTAPSNKFKYNRSKFKHINPKSKYIPFLFSKNNKILVKDKNNELFYIKQIGTQKEEIIIKNKSIIEMTYSNGSWFPHKNRFDKDKQYNESIKRGFFDGPNALHIARFIMDLIKKPITTEMITSGQIYYTGIKKKNSLIQNMIKFNNMIKKSIYNDYLKKDMKLLELSGGRGGDLYGILEKNPSYVFFTNYAKDSLIEAKRRYNDFISKNSKLKTNIKFEEYNLRNNKSNNIILKSSNKKFDMISCQFALHYFFESEETWINFFNIINNSIKKNGFFAFTCFDGNRIKEKLKKIKKTKKLELKINNKTVLSFTKLYDGRRKSVFGNTLGCFVETIGEHPEYLVDIQYLIDFFIKNNYELVENVHFHTLFSKYNIDLLNVEKEFTGLYNKVVFKKI